MGALPAMQPYNGHHRSHLALGGGLGVPALAFAAALVTAIILWMSDATVRASNRVDCNSLSSYLDRRHQHAHVQQLLSEATAVPIIDSEPGPEQAAAVGGMQPATAAMLGGVAADVLRRVGWRRGVQFARFDAGATLDKVLEQPLRYSGSFVLIVTGRGPPLRRSEDTPFLSIDPSAANLTAVLSPAAAVLNAAVGVVESSLGRRLFPFRLESAPLPPCAAGSGPCAVWEASSGRLVLDEALAGRMAAGTAALEPAAAGAAASTAEQQEPYSGAAASEVQAYLNGRPVAAAVGQAAEASAAAGEAADPAAAREKHAGGSSSVLSALLADFVELLVGQAAEATKLLQEGEASPPALATIFARAGTTAVTLLMASQVPLWWCIVCPLTLGMLAPFLFNFGLTAAAEALCAQLHLPDDTCSDLWWGAFAVALMLSLGSAIPIVYICRLPECGRRTAAAAATALAAVARMTAT